MSGKPLDPQRWQRIEGILDRIFDAPDDREKILEEACGSDVALRAEVEALLVAEARIGPLDGSSAHATLAGEALADATGSSLEGRHLGPYRVDRVLGAGGMGVVYEGWDTRLERPVAIKLLPPGLTQGDAQDRFLREARTASALDHANICSIYDIGTHDDGRPYLVMARYQGETLRRRLDRGPMPVDEARRIACRVARGLSRAHGAGIVHRDIKPANIFLTEHDEVKILDFGLAKMADDAGLTLSGALIGTPAYMAPEQARGDAMDARADIWAVGVLLYEMLSGRRPFRTGSSVGSLIAVLQADPDPLMSHCPDVPPDMLQLVDRCLAKDPALRPQSMDEVLGRLGDQESRASSGAPTLPAGSGAGAKSHATWWLVAVVALLVLGFAWWSRQGDPQDPGAAPSVATTAAESVSASTELPSQIGLVVLSFQNLSPEPELDALGRTITEMLVTDLRGSPDLDVTSTPRLYRAMDALGLSGAEPQTAETIRRLSEQTGKENVLHGKITRLGGRFRILATLEQPASDGVLLSKQLESDEAGLFNAVDELSTAVRSALEARAVGAGSIQGVTTESLEAMRLYSESRLLYWQQNYDASIAALEKAVELDPRFALAWRRLGLVHSNRNHREQAKACLQRAFELADRLPPEMRFTVQADHYGSSWSTLDRAIETYEQGLALYPQKTAWLNNLGYTLAQVERFEEALAHYEKAIALGTGFGFAYVNAGLISIALGRSDEGFALLSGYAERNPGQWAWQNSLAWHLIASGRLAEAETHLQRAQGLVAEPEQNIERNQWRLHVMRQDWPQAEAAAEALARMQDPDARLDAELARARVHLLHGRSQQALGHLDNALVFESWLGKLYVLQAQVRLARGEPDLARHAALRARQEDPGSSFERRALVLAALTAQALGEQEQADEHLSTLRVLAGDRPNSVEARQIHYLTGLLAYERGTPDVAYGALRQAVELLPKRGIRIANQPPYLEVLWAFGRAAEAAGYDEQALEAYRRVAEAGSERLAEPLVWTRCLFRLGEHYERIGRTADARKLLRQFLSYRADGDLDLDWVAAAGRIPG